MMLLNFKKKNYVRNISFVNKCLFYSMFINIVNRSFKHIYGMPHACFQIVSMFVENVFGNNCLCGHIDCRLYRSQHIFHQFNRVTEFLLPSNFTYFHKCMTNHVFGSRMKKKDLKHFALHVFLSYFVLSISQTTKSIIGMRNFRKE